MAKHSISEAARMTGASRATIHRHIKDGKISKEIDSDGKPCIDTSELVRVYGDLSHGDSRTRRTMIQPDTPSNDRPDRALQGELEALRREKIDRLESALSEMRQERDSWKAQAERLSVLLTAPPPPAPEMPATAPEKPAGGVLSWLARVTGGQS